MYINYKLKDGIEYAMVVTSVRKGASVTKEKPLYLGRVIDKEHGIFKNRVRGIYKYDIKPILSAASLLSTRNRP